MGTAILAQYEAFDDKYSRMMEYLSSEGRYWIDNDQWHLQADSFQQASINTEKRKTGKLADFRGYQSEQLKNEMKYFLLYSMKNGLMSASNLYVHYKLAIRQIGSLSGGKHAANSFSALDAGDERVVCTGEKLEMERLYHLLKRDVIRFIRDYYDDRAEMEKDVWSAARIPGTKVSAAGKREKPSISFESVKRHIIAIVNIKLSLLIQSN